MPTNGTLTPREAAYVATNAYFTLENWINQRPKAGTESRANVHNRVLGAGNAGRINPQHQNPTLKGTGLAKSKLGSIHTAVTGVGTTSGFGYTLTYRHSERTHVIIAMRGTRPEMSGIPDVLTDLRGAMTSFADYGLVHKGFKATFDSVLPSLDRDNKLAMNADTIHCVGHSLGGGVASLIAAHYASRGKAVKLYTFGSPRVGAFSAHIALERRIGKGNIYRVAHDLDPISLIGPYPYIHMNPSRRDENNMTLPSPTGSLLSTMNHDMQAYISSAGDVGATWGTVRGYAARVDHDNSLLARWLLHGNNDPMWVQAASVKTLGILFKLFSHVLKTLSTSLILSLTAVDLLSEILYSALHNLKGLGEKVLYLMRCAAKWCGIDVSNPAQFTARIIRLMLSKMLMTLQHLAVAALNVGARALSPMPLLITGAWALSSYSAF